jgi:GalNAc-alpha-(1->4)-GalNAc-alpha-(1->3)-diNAcBac-PP-undecaprenol alpha-1,4-N-acetyl-D-galactosaminyltransferase
VHILFYYGSMQGGGAERVIASLANNFVTRGAKITIMVLDDRPSKYYLDERVNYVNMAVTGNSHSVFEATVNNIQRLYATRKQMKHLQPDVVVCFGINNFSFAYVARLFLRYKIIGSERSNPYTSSNGFWGKMKKYLSPMADGYIFQTNGARSYYPVKTQKYGIVIPNGIFASQILDTLLPVHKRKDKIICATGRLHKVKGYETLIRAFSIFHKKHADYTLQIVGEGPERKNIEKQIEDLGLSEYVNLLGFSYNISDILCSSSMFVLSSLHEGMPNSLIEAMACGLPCISTDCDFGPSELIINGKNGLLVPVGDAEKMAVAMVRIANDSEFANYLANNALSVHKTHSMEKITNEFYNYIEFVAK